MGSSFETELEKLNEDRKLLFENHNGLNAGLKSEIDAVIQKYEDLEQKAQDEINEKNNKIDDMCERVARSSWFDGTFAHLLADLMTTFEGRKYVYQKVEYACEDTEVLAFDRISKNATKYVDVIALEDEIPKYYPSKGVDSLNYQITKGKLVLLNTRTNTSASTDFCFYEADKFNHSLSSKIDLEKFAYIEHFVNRVIDWKVNNSGKEISLDQLKEMEVQFLRDNEEMIKLNYNTRENEDRSVLEKRREERNAKLSKMLTPNL